MAQSSKARKVDDGIDVDKSDASKSVAFMTTKLCTFSLEHTREGLIGLILQDVPWQGVYQYLLIWAVES
eukprot:9284544-Ditylum_brightwellii.AAC.1